eukprot:3957381-Heterocapsa_arctica.AAC.1
MPQASKPRHPPGPPCPRRLRPRGADAPSPQAPHRQLRHAGVAARPAGRVASQPPAGRAPPYLGRLEP